MLKIGVVGSNLDHTMQYEGANNEPWIRPYYGVSQEYIHYVESADALPIVILPTRNINTLIGQFQEVDALMFAGGGHLPSSSYGETPANIEEETQRIMPEDHVRFLAESIMMGLAHEHHTPYLAICRGLQLLNIKQGGSLHQTLHDKTDVPHKGRLGPNWKENKHPIRLASDSMYAQELGTTIVSMTSMHDQGIKMLGEDLDVIATSPDGLIEMIMRRAVKYGLQVGVQGHPEQYPNDPLSRLLIGKLVTNATVYDKPTLHAEDFAKWQAEFDALDLQHGQQDQLVSA